MHDLHSSIKNPIIMTHANHIAIPWVFLAVWLGAAGSSSAQPEDPAPQTLQRRVTHAQKNFAKVRLHETKAPRVRQMGLLVRDGQIIDTLSVSAVKPGYFVCQTKSVPPRVGDEVAIAIEPETAETEAEVPAADKRTAKQQEEHQRWLARLEVRGIEPWPELTDEEHEAATAKHKEFVQRVGGVFPGMTLHETKNFLFSTNIPPQQVEPYVVSLDAMHDLMCKMYNVPAGSRVWRGKALVVAFLNQNEFARFEAQFMRTSVSAGIYGLCHQQSDGEVVIGCYRGERAEEFAQMLVHETSHGFIHRYKTPVRFPNWVNEGMADWVGLALVPQCKSVKLGERRAIELMQRTKSMGGDFFTTSQIDSWQYGLASNLAEFMIRNNSKAYVDFIEGMKEGMTWEESMQQAYASTPEQLVRAYGRAIGVPDLRP